MLLIYSSTVFPLSLQQNGSSLRAVLNLSYLLFTHQCPVQCLTNTFHEWMNRSSTVSKSSLNAPSIVNDDNSLYVLIRCYHHSLSQLDTLWVLILFQWLHTLFYLISPLLFPSSLPPVTHIVVISQATQFSLLFYLIYYSFCSSEIKISGASP